MPISSVPSQVTSILATKTYDSLWFSGSTIEQQIQNAINAAVADGAARVLIHGAYNRNLVTFNNTIQMVFEGADWNVYDIRAYGAPVNGIDDATPAINAALAAAPRGRAVYCPSIDVGYVINGQIIIPHGRVLLGDFRGPGYSRWAETIGLGSATTPGSTFFRITSTTITPIVLRTNSRVEGIIFWYPNQLWNITSLTQSFVTYPSTIQLGDASEAFLSHPMIWDCHFLGATRCIDQYATDGTSVSSVEILRCSGVLLGDFIRIRHCGDVVRVSNCHFNPNAAQNYVGDGQVGGNPIVFATKAMQTAVVFHLGRIDGLEVESVFAFGVRHYARWERNFYTGDLNEGPCGDFTDCAGDGTYQAFRIERDNTIFPLNITNSWFTPFLRPNGVAGDSASQAFISLGTGVIQLRINVSNVRIFAAANSSFSANYSGAPDFAFHADGAPGGTVNTIFVDQTDFTSMGTGIVPGLLDDVVHLSKFTFAGIKTQGFVSADRGDANVTLQTFIDQEYQRFATALTANRTVTLSTTSAYNGAHFRIIRTGLGAFTLDVGGLKTIPAATAAFVDVIYDGTAWQLTGFGNL